MGQLIDAMLSLARVTSADVRDERVDLSRIALSVATQLRNTDPSRLVDFVVRPNMDVVGDPHLIRALMENLLGNAWKFTSGRERARIEVGVLPDVHPPVYFVRDNGAGFDMVYADKLFAPFQRLHTSSQFPGTGIGLATVHRIVDRHGGRVWAEGVVDEGAMFKFTLTTPSHGDPS
jgi:light-regulated signal transduction histidine kinase (bacteriophytochrome)